MLPLRLVLDTNVVVSAALKPDGLQRTVLNIASTPPARLYVSELILQEYREVLSQPKMKIRKGARNQLLQFIANRAHLAVPRRMPVVTEDPSDNIFIECADAARADYLVTGNPRHFPRFWRQTKIITPRDFVTLAAPHLIRTLPCNRGGEP